MRIHGLVDWPAGCSYLPPVRRRRPNETADLLQGPGSGNEFRKALGKLQEASGGANSVINNPGQLLGGEGSDVRQFVERPLGGDQSFLNKAARDSYNAVAKASQNTTATLKKAAQDAVGTVKKAADDAAAPCVNLLLLWSQSACPSTIPCGASTICTEVSHSFQLHQRCTW